MSTPDPADSAPDAAPSTPSDAHLPREFKHGLVLSVPPGSLVFISAQVAERVIARPNVSPVPNSRLGMALIEGRVFPVVSLSPELTELILCRVNPHGYGLGGGGAAPTTESTTDELVALSGARVVASGKFLAVGRGVEHAGELVEPLDLLRLADG